MAYAVSEEFTNKLYSGDSEFKANLIINGNTIPNDQIASISISSPIVDDSKEVFYLGSFIAQKITIKFKNMDGIEVESGQDVFLSISQYVGSSWVEVPIGFFLIDDLAENYHEKCEITCLDYSVKFKPNIDYSECFVDGKATIETILKYICRTVGVELGEYNLVNNDIEIGTYDSTVSGKQWISYIAEIKGCNAKMDRQGRLTLQPLKQSSNVPINALQSASFDIGENYKITQVTYFDAIRNYTFGSEEKNTLFIRQDNPFVNDENCIKNIYEMIVNQKENDTNTEFELNNTDEYKMSLNTLYGNTSQETYSGKNLFNAYNYTLNNQNGTVTVSNDDYIRFINNTGGGFVATFNKFKVKSSTKYRFTVDIKNQGQSQRVWIIRQYDANNTKIKEEYVGTTTTSLKTTENTATTMEVLLTTQNTNTRDDFTVRLQVEEGETATSYEKYVGGTPSPNPDYPQNINVVTGHNYIKNYNINLITNIKISGNLTLPTTIVSPSSSYISMVTSFDDIFYNNYRTKGYTLKYKVKDVLNNGAFTNVAVGNNWNVRISFSSFTQRQDGDYTIYETYVSNPNYDINTNSEYPYGRFVTIFEDTSQSTGCYMESVEVTLGDTRGKDIIENKNELYEIDLGKNLFDKNSARIISNAYLSNGTSSIQTSSSGLKILYIPIKSNFTYTISKPIGKVFRVATCKELPTISTTTYQGFVNDGRTTPYTITTNSDSKYLLFNYIRGSNPTEDYTEEEILSSIQIEEGNKATSYAPYYNVSKNLFDKDNANLLDNMYLDQNNNKILASNGLKTIYIPCEPSATYTVSKIASARFRVATTKVLPAENIDIYGRLDNDSGTKITITTSNDSKYLVVFLYNQSFDTLTYQQIINTLQIEQGSTATDYEPYDKHIELCKIGDYQDYITKNTGKNLFDNGDIWVRNNINDFHDTGNNNTTRIRTQNPIKLEGGNTYTISGLPSGITIGLVKFYENTSSTSPTSTTNTPTFTVPTDATYVLIQCNGENFTNETNTLMANANIQIEQGSTATDYEPYGKDEWYKCSKIKKKILNGTETWHSWYVTTNDNVGFYSYDNSLTHTGLESTYNYSLYCDMFSEVDTKQNVHQGIKQGIKQCGETGSIDLQYIGISLDKTKLSDISTQANAIKSFKTWLLTNNTVVYCKLLNPTYVKITYQPLIDQLNAVENMKSYEGKTYITSRGVEENAPINIDYYVNTDFELYSLKTRNYGDFTLDAWDNINYQLGNKNYFTLNNNNLTYEMTIMGNVDTKIPTKQQEITTNIVGGDDKVNIKKIKTEVDNLNGTATILAQQTEQNSSQIAQLRVDYNSIQNLFTLTGGKNYVRNSAFLLQDEVWNFTNNGSNPYHTDFGKAYDVSLLGKTLSSSEIKLQNIITKTNEDNIVGIINDGTQYNLSFYYKQDSDTTTTIKLYDTNNTTVKAFNDIVITGQQEFKSFDISFVPTSTSYTFEITTSTTASSGYFYIYDLMLNSGDKQPWSPASDEVYSTTLQMSRLGLQVYSVGDGTITILGSDGLVSFETTDGKTLGNLVSKRTVDGDLTRSNTSELIGLTPNSVNYEAGTDKRRWVETTSTLNNKLHKILYLETGE